MPNNKYSAGDTVYFVESQWIIREVKVISCGGGFYTMKFVDGSGGIRLRENRLFSTKEEAENFIPKSQSKPIPQKQKRYRSP